MDEEEFTDEDARAILKRAAEIEQQGLVTAADLRDIAGEASISQAALNRALAEVKAERRVSAEAEKKIATITTQIAEADRQSTLMWYHRPLRFRTVAWVLAAAYLLFGVLMAIAD
ncbi:MAG: hypothetical protein ABIV28_02395 [Longimicrobiales bacterium]